MTGWGVNDYFNPTWGSKAGATSSGLVGSDEKKAPKERHGNSHSMKRSRSHYVVNKEVGWALLKAEGRSRCAFFDFSVVVLGWILMSLHRTPYPGLYSDWGARLVVLVNASEFPCKNVCLLEKMVVPRIVHYLSMYLSSSESHLSRLNNQLMS